ncbi:MAG TPA: AI-2E family transporter [Thermoanaerobaculaceae bacterium]|nr:AI-2E family transporter [Thermoanaerobaculaceae bacterium]
MDRPDQSRAYTVIFFLIATLGVGFLCYRVLTPFLAAIAWAVILAVAFQTPWSALERKMPRHRGLAAALFTLALALIVLLPAVVFIAVLASQAIDAANLVAAKLSGLHLRSFSDFVALPGVAQALDGLQSRLGIAPEDFQKIATSFVAKASATAAGVSGKLILSLFDAVLTFFLVIFLLFFFLKDGREMAASVFDLLPTDAEGRSQLARSLQSMLAAIFRGSLLCALAQGTTGAVGWWIAGLPSPALAGAVMAILSLLPVGGTAIAWLPGSVYLWSTSHPGPALFLFVWGLTVTSILADNVLRPMLIRGAEELSTLVVFLGVFGGLAAFGLLGIFIGPVALALAITLVATMRRAADAATVLP